MQEGDFGEGLRGRRAAGKGRVLMVCIRSMTCVLERGGAAFSLLANYSTNTNSPRVAASPDAPSLFQRPVSIAEDRPGFIKIPSGARGEITEAPPKGRLPEGKGRSPGRKTCRVQELKADAK
ncbi:hypothetical protein E2C01_055392 [Portunus trituberculatus]|uniref:Uncharacterized protein n=1 Tax=Portunus trituberculatus TaxID=210409 RepID=A0A5B7GR20_PORTR|nr:hypothetical protein [Portunus trituberculatus]